MSASRIGELELQAVERLADQLEQALEKRVRDPIDYLTDTDYRLESLRIETLRALVALARG